ncbi:MAG: hypothetical protein AAGF99_18120 [Bacteroidota bacterium]
MILTARAKVWAALCRHRHAETGPTSPIAKERLLRYTADVEDGHRLLDRLAGAGLILVTEAKVSLTSRGLRAVETMLQTGQVPAIVMQDPADWRQRAWTAMRIHRSFTARDIATILPEPSYEAVQRYCKELVDAGILRLDGTSTVGRRRYTRYRLIRNVGPDHPRLNPTARRRETDPDRPWRRRAWSAMLRLGAAGQGFSSLDVSAAAQVSDWQARELLRALLDAGAINRPAKQPLDGGGWVWLYALAEGGQQAARPVLRHRGLSDWKPEAWELLINATEPVTPSMVAELTGCSDLRAHLLLEAAVGEGFARHLAVEGTTQFDGNGYLPTEEAPETLPSLLLTYASRPVRGRGAEASADAPDASAEDASAEVSHA